MIRVHYWSGTSQRTETVTTYAEAMELIDSKHRNAYPPRFYTEGGERLIDTGDFFVAEAEAAKSNPKVYA